jgi:hypothetical protein
VDSSARSGTPLPVLSFCVGILSPFSSGAEDGRLAPRSSMSQRRMSPTRRRGCPAVDSIRRRREIWPRAMALWDRDLVRYAGIRSFRAESGGTWPRRHEGSRRWTRRVAGGRSAGGRSFLAEQLGEREAWPENDGVLFCFFGMYRWLNLVCVSVWEMGQEVVGPFVASSIPFCPFSFSFVGYWIWLYSFKQN